MNNRLSLFFFRVLVSCLCSRSFTAVKASLFTLIVIDLASEGEIFFDGKGGYAAYSFLGIT